MSENDLREAQRQLDIAVTAINKASSIILTSPPKQSGNNEELDWRELPPSEKQLQYLGFLKYNGDPPANRGAAHDLIKRLKGDAQG